MAGGGQFALVRWRVTEVWCVFFTRSGLRWLVLLPCRGSIISLEEGGGRKFL